VIGPLDHVYYWVRDMDVAVAFYAEVLELDLRRREGDEWAEFDAGPLRLALHGSETTTATEGTPGGGTAVFRVEDLDTARWQLEQRGARFDEHVGEVAGFARFATFRDPDGNALQLIEYLGGRAGQGAG
jgi:CreA protein